MIISRKFRNHSMLFSCFRVTKEHRENLSKGAKALFVKCKDIIKEIQNKNIKLLKDNDNLATDLVFNLQNQVL